MLQELTAGSGASMWADLDARARMPLDDDKV